MQTILTLTLQLLDLSVYSTATDTDLSKATDKPSHVSVDSPRYTRKGGRQESGRVSPVSPVVANLYMEEVESRALITIPGTALNYWFGYVDHAWVQIRAREVEAFTEHINALDSNIKFTREDVRGDSLPFLDCAVHIEEDRKLNTHRSILDHHPDR